jgi:hypothetical protein
MRRDVNLSAETRQKVSRYVFAGAVLFPLGLLLLLLLILTTLSAALHTALVVLACIVIIASTILGFLGIRQIRKSEGAYSGMRVAVFLSLFYPIIVLDLILFMLGFSILGNLTTSSLVPLAWLVVVILVDYWIVRISWNRAIL